MLDRHFIFFPERRLLADPSDKGLEFENIFFWTSDKVKLHGWFVPGRGDATFLWFHGNAGNISHRLDNVFMLHQRLNANLFIFDYRGYGLSEGKTSEEGTYLDGEAALDYLRSREDIGEKLVLFGRSLGCAVAVEMATRHQVYGLILESAFTSVKDMAKIAYPYLPIDFITRLFQARYDSMSKIKKIHSPLMVLHGDRDDVVPVAVAQNLFQAANDPKRFYTIEKAGHNDTYLVGGNAYFEALRRFIENPVGKGYE